MKAIVVNEIGGPEQLVVSEVPEPTAGPEDLLVAVEAAGLNFIDVYHRIGLYNLAPPFTPGQEGAGTVVGVGAAVRDFEVGDRVGWANALGAYAEVQVVPAGKAIPIPSGIDVTTVSAILLQGITAHFLSADTYHLAPGDRCLIHAGAGGVGLLLTQMAKQRGAEVLTTVGTTDKAELSRKAGADHVIVYSDTDFAEAVVGIAGPHALDVVYDGVGAATFMKGLDLLRPRGLMVTFGNASGPVPEISPLILSQKGSLFLTRPTMGNYIATREELLARCHDLFTWLEAGSLEVRIDAEYPLAEAPEAHRALEGRRTTGKVLIRP